MKKPLILFDGYCNLCSSVINSILLYDRRKRFDFVPLQSPLGAEMMGILKARYGRVPDSIVLVFKEKVYIKSEAVLRIAGILGGIWYLLLIFWLLPRPVRNALYDWIARKRYRWFGKRETCLVPEEGHARRFLTELPQDKAELPAAVA